MSDDLRQLRARIDDQADAISRATAPVPDRGLTMLGQVYQKTTIPTTTGVYYAVHPVDPGGVEGEGNAASNAVDTSTTAYFLVLGPGVPTAGDTLLGHSINGRWVARKRQASSTTVVIAGCPCPATPSPLSVTPNDPTANFGIFQAATLVFGPMPSWAITDLSMPTTGFLSTSTYVDTVTADPFYYYFTCVSGFYTLTRIYEHSIFGSGGTGPFRDLVRYKWLIGGSGNTCSPFHMNHGTIYVGGDPTTDILVVP